jgi:hypothetical protein
MPGVPASGSVWSLASRHPCPMSTPPASDDASSPAIPFPSAAVAAIGFHSGCGSEGSRPCPPCVDDDDSSASGSRDKVTRRVVRSRAYSVTE